jgi:protein gp37
MYRQSGYTKFDPNVPTVLNPKAMESRLRKFVKDGAKVIFVNSMSDTFHDDFDFKLIESWYELFKTYPDVQFQILTKRIERARTFFQTYQNPSNCWIGTSIGTKRALKRLDSLKQINAKIRFVSFEPLLEDLGEIDLHGIQWAIVGGESDFTNPRPFKSEWAESIRIQCERLSIPFFFKQNGGDKSTYVDGVYGGNLLNGVLYHQMPVLLGTKQSTLASTNEVINCN